MARKPKEAAKKNTNGEALGLETVLRNALLPKLLSGEIRVNGVERNAGRCA